MTISLGQAVIDWITGLGWDTTEETGYPLFEGPMILDEPDRSVWVTGTGGPGYITDEGSADAATFQLRVRGPSDDADEPQVIASQLDALVLGALFPVVIDGYNIQHVHRLGGRPTPLPVNPQDLRHEFTCNYTVIVGS